MRLQDYVNILRKWWWIVALVALSAAASAYAISKVQRPVYRSQATYSATINRADSGVYIFANQTLNSFIRLVHNRTTFRAISQQLELDLSPEKLMEDVRMQAQPDELTIKIEADSPNVDDPPRMIDAVGQALIARVAEKNRVAEGQDRVTIVAEEPGPVFKAKPNTRINTLAGGILGLIVGVLLAFVLEYRDDTLKTPTDIEEIVGLTTLASVPRDGLNAPARARLRPAPVARIVDRR